MHKELCSQSSCTNNRCQLTRLISQHVERFETHLEEWVPRDDAKEAFKALPPCFDDLVGEAVREDLAGERGDVDSRRLALEDIAEGLKV